MKINVIGTRAQEPLFRVELPNKEPFRLVMAIAKQKIIAYPDQDLPDDDLSDFAIKAVTDFTSNLFVNWNSNKGSPTNLARIEKIRAKILEENDIDIAVAFVLMEYVDTLELWNMLKNWNSFYDSYKPNLDEKTNNLLGVIYD